MGLISWIFGNAEAEKKRLQALSLRAYYCDASRFNYHNKKSEKVLAELLEKQKILFNYEDAFLMNVRYENGLVYPRLFNPDFHLLEMGLVMEFEGQKPNETDNQYQERIAYRREPYIQNGNRAIFIQPQDLWTKPQNGDLRGDYEKTVLDKIKAKAKEVKMGRVYLTNFHALTFQDYRK